MKILNVVYGSFFSFLFLKWKNKTRNVAFECHAFYLNFRHSKPMCCQRITWTISQKSKLVFNGCYPFIDLSYSFKVSSRMSESNVATWLLLILSQDPLWETHYVAVQWYLFLHTGTGTSVYSHFIRKVIQECWIQNHLHGVLFQISHRKTKAVL